MQWSRSTFISDLDLQSCNLAAVNEIFTLNQYEHCLQNYNIKHVITEGHVFTTVCLSVWSPVLFAATVYKQQKAIHCNSVW